MSPRFFFDVSNGGETIHDEVGVDAESLTEVLAEARSVIIEMADEVRENNPNQMWMLIVRDEGGYIVGRLAIKQ